MIDWKKVEEDIIPIIWGERVTKNLISYFKKLIEEEFKAKDKKINELIAKLTCEEQRAEYFEKVEIPKLKEENKKLKDKYEKS